jgi:exoribonuclease II
MLHLTQKTMRVSLAVVPDHPKLRAFFVQCELNFQNKTRSFRSDWAKANFAQSYLKGMALEYFEPSLLMFARTGWMTIPSLC